MQKEVFPAITKMKSIFLPNKPILKILNHLNIFLKLGYIIDNDNDIVWKTEGISCPSWPLQKPNQKGGI